MLMIINCFMELIKHYIKTCKIAIQKIKNNKISDSNSIKFGLQNSN